MKNRQTVTERRSEQDSAENAEKKAMQFPLISTGGSMVALKRAAVVSAIQHIQSPLNSWTGWLDSIVVSLDFIFPPFFFFFFSGKQKMLT